MTSKAYSAQSCPLASAAVTYTYDSGANAIGHLTGVTDQAGSASYSYDTLGRLASETRTINGISKSLSYDYNLDGSLKALHYPSGAVVTYTPDSAGRFTTAAYGYDGNRLRVQKTVGATTTTYVFSGAKVIAEYANGSLSKEYIYFAGRLLSTIAPTNFVTYHHGDQSSDRLETDAVGNVVRTFCNLPFGDTWYETGAAEEWKFTTYERDSESTLDYAVNRFYSSGYGRFTSVDLLAGILVNPQSLNRYAYVRNDPVDSVDPLGLDRCRFNIGIADNAGLSTEHLAEIEARIDQIFSATDDNGDSVGATFDPKQKADYTLHFDSGPHGDDGYYIFGVYPPTVYTDSITRDYGADNFGIAAGTVGAHELFHNITHTKDQPYDIGLDNRNLMTSDSANDQGVNSVPDEINPEVTGFAKLTSDQIRQLFRKCLAKHPKRGNGGGAGSGPKKDVPGDAGVGGPLSGDASEGDPCPNGDCGPGSGWDPDADPPTLHQRP